MHVSMTVDMEDTNNHQSQSFTVFPHSEMFSPTISSAFTGMRL